MVSEALRGGWTDQGYFEKMLELLTQQQLAGGAVFGYCALEFIYQ